MRGEREREYVSLLNGACKVCCQLGAAAPGGHRLEGTPPKEEEETYQFLSAIAVLALRVVHAG